MTMNVAHRGASGHYPENTILAFKEGLKMGSTALEFDIHLCKSGEIVVIHDEDLKRTTNGKGKIIDHTLEELKKLDAGFSQKIPTLEELLDEVPISTVMFIEIKVKGMTEELKSLLHRAVTKRKWPYKNFVIISFYNDELIKMKRLMPEIEIGFGFDKLDRKKTLSLYEIVKPYSVNLCIDYIKKKDVEFVHELGSKVFVWTVNSNDKVKYAKKLNVDGIMTDYPELV